MSLFRREVQNGLLVATKRHLLRWWMWSYNHCVEDQLTRLRNERTAAIVRLKQLNQMIPHLEKNLEDEKKALSSGAGYSRMYRAPWRAAKPAVMLRVPPQKAKKKPAQPNAPPKPSVLAELTIPRR